MNAVEQDQHPFRRFLRFRLRTFLVVFTIVSVWFGLRLRTAREQHAAVIALSEIESNRSSVAYEYGYDFDRSGNVVPNADPPGPNLLYRGARQHFFARVVGVSLDGTRAADADLRHLAKLPHLTRLDLEYTSVTDSGLEFVIRRFPDLTRLDVQSTQVTSKGLQHVGTLRELRYLLFGQSPFSDTDFQHFSQLTSLEAIKASDAELDGSGLRHLKSLPRLSSLDLRKNPISDPNLAHLIALRALKRLSLRGSAITDEGVQQICRLTTLRELDVAKTKISPEGLERIQLALPKCTIQN